MCIYCSTCVYASVCIYIQTASIVNEAVLPSFMMALFLHACVYMCVYLQIFVAGLLD